VATAKAKRGFVLVQPGKTCESRYVESYPSSRRLARGEKQLSFSRGAALAHKAETQAGKAILKSSSHYLPKFNYDQPTKPELNFASPSLIAAVDTNQSFGKISLHCFLNPSMDR
jgi:hypothetical protein